MSVFSDIDIKRALLDGSIVCRPLNLANIKGSSLDLTLGKYFWRCDARPHGVFNPYDRAEVERYFDGPFEAKPYASVYQKIGRDPKLAWPAPAGDSEYMGHRSYGMPHPFNAIPENWPVIVMRPGERILGHSHEFTGARGRGTTMLKARSTSGRIGMKVCDDAGWGDPEFVNRWTWELRNDNKEAIILPVGERMAQLVFFQTGPVEHSYEGKYQDNDKSIDELIEQWVPDDMLPRCWKDERQEPLPLDASLYLATLAELSALTDLY